MEKNKKNGTEIITSLGEMTEIITYLVKIYNLEKNIEEEKEVKEKISEAETCDQKMGIKIAYSEIIKKKLDEGKTLNEALPFRKLKIIIKEFLEKKFSKDDLPIIIGERLGLQSKDARNLAKDIESRFSFLLKKMENVEILKEKEEKIMEEKESLDKKTETRKPSFSSSVKITDNNKTIGKERVETSFKKEPKKEGKDVYREEF